MTWIFLGNLFCRVISFGGQLVLGWLLTPREFGIYALSLSISMAVGALRHGGSAQLLIQRGQDYEVLAGQLTKYAFGFNVLAMSLLLAIAPFAPRLFKVGELAGMLVCIAFSFPLGTLAMIFHSKLSIDRRFEDIAKINFGSTLVWQVSVVWLAWCGFGAMSFVVPLIIQAFYENVLGWYYVREMPCLKTKLPWQEFKSIFRGTRWLMLSAGMLSLAMAGDYFAVGLISDEKIVGNYFFAFQIVVVIATLFNNGVETVVPSLLAPLNIDRARQDAAFHKTLKMLLLATIPVAFAFCFLAAPLIHFLWRGKWDTTVAAVQFLAACVPAWLVVAAARALIEARGLWRTRFRLLLAYGVGGMASAALGALIGGVTEIAMSVSLYYAIFALTTIVFMPSIVGVARGAILEAVYKPLLLSLFCAAASFSLAWYVFNGNTNILRDIICFLVFSVLVIGGNAILFRTDWKEVILTIMVPRELSFGKRINFFKLFRRGY